MELSLPDLLFPTGESPSHHSVLGQVLPHRFVVVPSTSELDSGLLDRSRYSAWSAPRDETSGTVAVVSTLNCLAKVWPDGLGFVAAVAKKIFPFHQYGDRWVSATSANQPTVIAATLDVANLPESVETIIHESSHLALFRIEQLSGFQTNETPKYRHPWRQELRPARGALLAAHAFSNVVELCFRMSRHYSRSVFHDRAVEMSNSISEITASLLSQDDLTFIGREISSLIHQRVVDLGEQYAN